MKETRGIRRLLAYIVMTLMLIMGMLVLFRGQVYAFADARASEPELADVDPALRHAMEVAMRDAAGQGVRLRVVSGGRSLAEQRELYEKAVAEHGAASAAKWAVPPNELSAHVKGLAVDVGPVAGSAWLREHGARYGLCQVYANEPWHFERTAKNGTCPALASDASAVEHF
ncbi:M15 family metallopeptidase domain-containing protein [Flindersiella endophytica]